MRFFPYKPIHTTPSPTKWCKLSFHFHFLAGSWDGEIRLWKIDQKLRSFSLIHSIPAQGVINTLQFISLPQSTSSTFSWTSSSLPNSTILPTTQQPQVHVNGSTTGKGEGKKSLLLVAGVGQEMKFGRWVKKKGEGVLNGSLVMLLHARTWQKLCVYYFSLDPYIHSIVYMRTCVRGARLSAWIR